MPGNAWLVPKKQHPLPASVTHHALSCSGVVAASMGPLTAWQFWVVLISAAWAAPGHVLLQDGESDAPGAGRGAAQPAASRGSSAAATSATSASTDKLQVSYLFELPHLRETIYTLVFCLSRLGESALLWGAACIGCMHVLPVAHTSGTQGRACHAYVRHLKACAHCQGST